MAFDWNSATVGDFVDLQRGNTYKSALLDTPGPVLLGLASIERDGGFRSDKLRTYGGESPEKLLVYPGDMYVSLKDVTQSGDLLGSVARVPGFIEVGRMTQDTVKLVFKNEMIDRSFLYWVLRSPEYREYCRARGMGTTNLSLSREDFLSFSIPEPTPSRISVQRTLDAIESKITLSREINQTLEAMAQTIFKSWFVDFDPVKAKIAAKQESRDPLRAAMSAISGKPDAELDALPSEQYDQLAATAALFPDEMEESELGEIPRGWCASKIEPLLERLPAKTRYKKEQVSEYGQIPVFEQGASVLLGYHNGTASYQANAENPMFIFGDHTCVTRLSCQPFDISQNVIPLQGQDRATVWVFYAIKEKQKFQEYRRHWMELISKDVVVATADICAEFSKRASNLHLQMEANERQMQNLRDFRDTLLPKLLSGELSVADALEAEA